mmetsp:Transcript_112720/g.318562  ORF Transcript_112720/g.318562 Transcript_112720/m.318562 type:complete len:225 (+) Transcript_112720:941-1615(+)
MSHAVALLCARAPVVPAVELAIHVGAAIGTGYLGVARHDLLREACHRLTTVVRRVQHRPVPHSDAAAARRGAPLPDRPFAPNAIHTLAARLRVAWRDLLFVHWLTWLAIAPSWRSNVAVAGLHAAATGARATTPLEPLAPLAIGVRSAWLQAHARRRLLQWSGETCAAAHGYLRHLPRADPLTGVACCVARLPIAPAGDLRVFLTAFAGPGLLQGVAAWTTAPC